MLLACTHTLFSTDRMQAYAAVLGISKWDQSTGFTQVQQHITDIATLVRCILLSLTVLCKDTFWVAVLSSARQVAKFLAHWPSCIAAAWSATVGTADFADVTILLPGWGTVTEKQQIHKGAVFECISDNRECDSCWLCQGERSDL